jgi:hypothetical protein
LVAYFLARFVLSLHIFVDVLEGLALHKLAERLLPAAQGMLELIKGQKDVHLKYPIPIISLGWRSSAIVVIDGSRRIGKAAPQKAGSAEKKGQNDSG